MDDRVTQLNGLRDALRAISGKEPAAADVQRLMALARVLGMRNDDGMLPILADLDTYHGIFSRLPAEMQASAKAAADGAAEQAKARINEAVAHLVPSVENAVARAAESTVGRVRGPVSLVRCGGGDDSGCRVRRRRARRRRVRDRRARCSRESQLDRRVRAAVLAGCACGSVCGDGNLVVLRGGGRQEIVDTARYGRPRHWSAAVEDRNGPVLAG